MDYEEEIKELKDRVKKLESKVCPEPRLSELE